MWVSQVIIQDIKSFDKMAEIWLDQKMNIVIGENNSGKSIIIKALYLLQNQNAIQEPDVRYGKAHGRVVITLADFDGALFGIENFSDQLYELVYEVNKTRGMGMRFANPSGVSSFATIQNREPNNFIYPFFAKRKVGRFEETVNIGYTQQVGENLANLVSKIDRLCDRNHPAHEAYRSACDEIIGFQVSTQPSDNGKKAGIWLDNFTSIPLEAMGDGVPHLLGLICNLCIAENKLFLIEELESDIHPKALKALLRLIISKTNTNQFVITTHSNIVAKYLGSISGSKLHYIGRQAGIRVPTATYREIANSTEERRAVLEELGYEMTDYDIWKGWLILEESSAERIINDFLIPRFAPILVGRLRTIAASGVSQVEPKFEDLNRLFLFTHLEPSYKNNAWVLVDNGEAGDEAINVLKTKYVRSGWNEECFIKLSKNNFEEYYPERFKPKVEAVLKIKDKQGKRDAKKTLFGEVLQWISKNEQEAEIEFASSAQEIIDILKRIENELS
jgi:hypothetical protein